MKKIITFGLTLIITQLYSQVSFGTTNLSSASVILEINGQNSGLVLPWVDNSSSVAPISGSIIFDTTDNVIKLYNGSSWENLTTSGAINASKLAEQNSHSELGNGVIIGTDSSDEFGVLNLKSNNKGFVLPKVNELSDIKNPESGTMVYVISLRTVAIFNGVSWRVLKRS